MKYLKSYRIFEADGPLDPAKWSSKDLTIPRGIQEDIYDMAFELKDEGYNVSFQWWPPYEKSNSRYKNNKYPSINITKSNLNEEAGLEKISYAWIKDFCERVSSYLDEKDYNTVVKFRKVNTNDYYDINKSYPNQEPFNEHHMATSIHFKIEMIDRNVYGDVNESNVLDQSVVDDCKDILLELEDIGIKTNINSHLNPHYTSLSRNDKNDEYYSYIQFSFNRESEFDYSDIEDVVERLKSYLSEFGLNIVWSSPNETQENKPDIKKISLINPTTFDPFVRTQCELFFDSN